MDGIDKLWADLAGHPLLFHAIHNLAPSADATVLVVGPGHVERAHDLLATEHLASQFPNVTVVVGGAERSDSVARGLGALPATQFVAVHDAARPFANSRLLSAGLALAKERGAAVPVIPVTDTLKRVTPDGTIEMTVNRSDLMRVQTPQVFSRPILLEAYTGTAAGTDQITDDAGIVEASGRAVATFPGYPANFKITTPEDLQMAREILAGLSR